MTNNDFIVFYDKDEYDDYLMHYGVLGMKWGVIRSRAKDRINKARQNHKINSDKRKMARGIAKSIKAQRKATAKTQKAQTKANVKAQKVQEKASAKAKKAQNKANVKTKNALEKKSFRNMSDEELRQRISRLQQEKQYMELDRFVNPQPTKQKGFASKMGDNIKEGLASGTKTIVQTGVSSIGKYYIVQGLTNSFGLTKEEAYKLLGGGQKKK